MPLPIEGPVSYLAFSLQSPTSGAWTLTITNPITSNQDPLPVHMEFRTNSTTGLTLSATSNQITYLPGQTIAVSATLQQIGTDGTVQPVGTGSGATVTAQIAPVLGTGFTPYTLTLSDDGTHGDGAPNDGIYGASFAAPSQPGQYVTTISASGAGSQRVTQVPWQVQSLTPIVTPAITLTADTGPAGAQIGITSTASFSPNEQVALTIGGVLLGTAMAQGDGTLSVTETVPSDVGGISLFTARGQNSGVTASAPFGVTGGTPILPIQDGFPQLTLVPSTASPGAQFQITSTGGFSFSELIVMTLGSVLLDNVHTTSDGTLAVTESVPISPTLGGPQLLMACGTTSTICASAIVTISTVVTLPLQAGWNLIALPLTPTVPLQAQDVLTTVLTSAGGTFAELASWSGSSWIVALAGGQTLGEFPVQVGRGYFLYTDTPGIYTITGTVPAMTPTLDLTPGWNLIGLPLAQGGQLAHNLLTSLTPLQAVEVASWARTSWQVELSQADGSLTGTDFPLSPQQGYFAYVQNGGGWPAAQPQTNRFALN